MEPMKDVCADLCDDETACRAGDQVLEYTSNLNFGCMNLCPGQAVHVYVDSHYISFKHPSIADRVVYGRCHYSPDSDISAVIWHSGVLFVDSEAKDSSRSRFWTVRNVFEIAACSDAEYSRLADVESVPADVAIRGVLVTIVLGNSPPSFRSSVRNGIRTRDSPRAGFSIRVGNFRLLSSFDTIPRLVGMSEYVSGSIALPVFRRTFTGDIGFGFDQCLVNQILSLSNIVNGLFDAYTVLFDVESVRYAVYQSLENDANSIPGFVANSSYGILVVRQLKESLSLNDVRRRGVAKAPGSIVARCCLSDLVIDINSIRFNDFLLSNVCNVLLMSLSGKSSRAPRF